MMKQQMNKIMLAGLIGLLVSVQAEPQKQARQDRPNIILILADDLGVMDVGFNGDERYKTPHLDRLAAEGMIFTEAYASAANCAPSRAALLSGKAAPRTGVYTVNSSERGKAKDRKLIPTPNTLYLSDDAVTLADRLKACGYVTCQMGKWHVGKDPTKQGVDINVAGSQWGHPKSYFSPYKNPNLPDGPPGEYLTDRLTDEAVRFISEHQHKPFFLYLPYYTVHTPLQARKDLLARYEGRTDLNPNYAAMVEALDENVGRLLEHLDTTGLSKNTLVVFSSDNGGVYFVSRQTPYRSGKGSYYEGGIRVPLAVRWPGRIPAGSTCDVPVVGLDLYPTLIEAGGGEAAQDGEIDGVSLLPLLTRSGTFEKRALYWHFPIYLQNSSKDDDGRDPLFRTRPGSVVRLGKWKLHEYFEDGALELYDLEKDPGERVNLAAEFPEQAEALKKRLVDWRLKLEAPVPTERNPKFKP